MHIVIKSVLELISTWKLYNSKNGTSHDFVINRDANEVYISNKDGVILYGVPAVQFLEELIKGIVKDGGFTSLQFMTDLKYAKEEAMAVLEEGK